MTINPTSGLTSPHVVIRVDDDIIFDSFPKDIVEIVHEMYLPEGLHRLEVELLGKSNLDPQQAISIKDLRINDISDKKFIWNGLYTPNYPEPWATEQRQQNIELLPCITNTDYLGWNGRWTLEFSSPIYTWIHRVQDHGWVYD